MRINFIWIGKPKHDYVASGISTYHKRLSRYCTTKIIQLKDVRATNSADQMHKEAQLFRKHMDNKSFNVFLDERGKRFSSIEFSNFISQLQNRSTKQLNMIIGGAYGFEDNFLSKSDFRLSLSRMTLPHDLCRLVLLEQVYRAFTFLNNEKYHHN